MLRARQRLEEEEQSQGAQKVFRTKHTRKFKDFIGKEGVVAKQLKKMFQHKYHVKILGTNHKKKTRLEHTTKKKTTIKTERDFAERKQYTINGQQQQEYFGKDESLGVEGVTVYFKPKGKDDHYENIFTPFY